MTTEKKNPLLVLTISSLVLAGGFYLSVLFFVRGLKYDYVTTSSVLFTVFLVSFVLSLADDLIKDLSSGDFVGVAAFGMAFLLAMGAVTAGLAVFTGVYEPEMSTKFDMVANFWGALAWPFVEIGRLAAKALPALGDLLAPLVKLGRAAVDFINPRETAQSTVSEIMSRMLASLVLLAAGLVFGKRFKPARTA